VGYQEIKVGTEGDPPVMAHLWCEAPPSETRRKRWWVVPFGTQDYVLVKKTHPLRLPKVGAPYERVTL
jgi:hypothetical protein